MSSTELQEIERKRKDSSSSSEHSTRKEKVEVEMEETDDPEVRFIQPTGNHNASDIRLDVGAPRIEFNGLTKEELMKYSNDPFWRKVRWVLFILFWILWAGMLVAAILIIILTPKCPVIPKQTFWQKSPGYHIDVATFKDSNGDGVGDIKGIIEKIDYIKGKGGFLILSSVIQGSLGLDKVRLPAITDFQSVDPLVGNLDDVKSLMKKCRKESIKIIIDLPPHTGKNHEWFKKAKDGDATYQKYYLWNDEKDSSLKNRVGKSVWNPVGKKNYWSSLHEEAPALNLNNSGVLDHLSAATKFWLKQGFDGIFINDAAFLAPSVGTNDVGSGLSGITVSKGTLASWYTTGHNGQIYTPDSVKFIQVVRKWIDEVKTQTDRERLLLVSSGNTGLKQNRNKTLEYLGTSSDPGAHLVMVYDLVRSNGLKMPKPKSPEPSLHQLVNTIISSDSVATVTQTLSGPRDVNFLKTCMNLLIPSTAITLYGEEIGIKGYGDSLAKTKAFSKPAYWYITNAALENKDSYVNDMIDSYDVPMQWTRDGGFYNNITSPGVYADQNVMSLETIGRGQTILNVFDELIKLRKEHSFAWGNMEWFEVQENRKTDPDHYIFTRSAKGFAKYIVILVQPKSGTGGKARNLSKLCKEASPVVAFPSNEDFKKGTKLPMENIYFRYYKKGSVFIFKCE